MSGDRLPLGTRVTKGPDWTWGNQGGGGPGTVVQHENKKHPYTWVWWDTGEYNRYPYGPDMGFHIWKTEEYPRIKLMHDPLDIGMIVKKGHSLENLETIRNATKGVIIRRSQDRKRLKVRWDNGIITECKINDVVYCDILTESEEKFVSLSEELFGHSLGREVKENVDARGR
ncbi:uncharacterized protein LOC112559028 [Pomacea canaliculata]|uniref:uncharacterized protein LOC112559028 n=1 Tax=Pomacea canaliculata TaxID=400727 RepID=UPI000D73B5CC|nr:uncharacterized protein LOC112559028 [Pomacea canaliculata]